MYKDEENWVYVREEGFYYYFFFACADASAQNHPVLKGGLACPVLFTFSSFCQILAPQGFGFPIIALPEFGGTNP